MTTIAHNNNHTNTHSHNMQNTNNMQTYPQRPNTFQSYLVPQVVYSRTDSSFNTEFPSLPVTRAIFNQQVGNKKDVPRMTHHLAYDAFLQTLEKLSQDQGLFLTRSGERTKVGVIDYLTRAPVDAIKTLIKEYVGSSINTDNIHTLVGKFRYEQVAGRLTHAELHEFLVKYDFYNPRTMSQLVYGEALYHGQNPLLDQLVGLLNEHAAELRPRFRGGNRPAVPLNLDNLQSLLVRVDREMQIYQDDVVALKRIYADNKFVDEAQDDAVVENDDGWQVV